MSRLAQARLLSLPTHTDARGSLTAVEAPRDVPFPIARLFWLHDLQPPFERGGHAHVETDHLLVCLRGRVEVLLTDGRERASFILDNPSVGLFVPRMVWTNMHGFSPDAILLAAASAPYAPSALMRDWDAFLARVDNDTASGDAPAVASA